MKKKIIKYAAAGMLLFISFSSFSQDNDIYNNEAVTHSVPAWISDKGYWVVENNIHQPSLYTVRFYNNENIMTGSMNMSGKMNMKRKKVKMQLKSMLESSVNDWAALHPDTTNKDLAKKP